MNIKQTIITTTVALTMVALIAPASVGALTAAELQAQINILMSQLAQLQTNTTVSGNVPAACVGVSFARNLVVGSTGSDVKCLQVLLNMSASTRISATGAGSPGMETSYFGARTLAAVRIYQANSGFTPANQVGPMTRAKLNAWLGTFGSNPNPNPNPNPVPMGAGLTVMLASDSPASNAVVSNAALVPLAKLTFRNGDNAQIKITGIKLNRIGVSADASLNNVYLFDGANRLTDSASVSSGLITFNDPNGLFTVDSMNSKSITIYSDLAANPGETLSVSLMSASNVSTNASSVNGTFPINGNLMAVASATLAGVNFASTTTPSAASVNPVKDQVVWENLVSVTTRSVWFNWFRLREIGTVNYADLQNFRLYVDGVMVGSQVTNLDANGYVTFDLSASPVTLQTGTRSIKVLADVVGGSSRTYTMSLRVVADAKFVDSQYGAAVLSQANSTTFSARTTGTQTINSGTITVQKATNSPSGNITNLASNQVLGRFTLTASGERVKIDTLTASVISSLSTVGCLRNGALFANGVQIGSTSDLYTTTNTTCGTGSPTSKAFSLGSSLIVDPMSPVTVEIRGDIYDNDGTNSLVTNTTLQAQLMVGSSNGQGQVSLVTSNVPSATLAANQLTVKVGALTLSKYTAYTNQNAVPPVSDLKLSHFTLSNDTVEPINISSIVVTTNYVSGNLTNLYVKYGTQQTITTTTVSAAATTYSVNFQLMPSQVIDVMVYGTVNANTVGVATSGVYITGTTANSATAVTAGTQSSATTGQTITFTTGSVASAVDAGTPLNMAVAGGQSVVAAKYKVTASNDSFTINEMKVAVASAAASAVANSVSLWDGNTLLATQPFNQTSNTVAYFTGLTLAVPANTSKVLSVSLDLVTPYTDGTTVTFGKNLKLTMTQLKVANSQGVQTESTPTNAGNHVYVYKSVPTFTLGTLPSGQGINLSSNTTTSLYKFNVAADAKGPIAMKQLKFTVTVTDNGTGGNLSLGTFKFFRGSTDITNSVTIQNTSGSTLEATNSVGEVAATVVVTFDTEEQIPASTSYDYTLKATPTGFLTNTSGADSVTTVLGSDTVPSDGTNDGGTAGADVTGFYLDATSTTGVQTLATSAAGAGTGTGSVSGGSVIWSDYSAQSHNYTYTGSSADWTNGYLLNNLPLDAQGVVAQ